MKKDLSVQLISVCNNLMQDLDEKYESNIMISAMSVFKGCADTYEEEKLQKAIYLIARMCSVELREGERKLEFFPMVEYTNGERSFLFDDLLEEDILLFEDIVGSIDSPLLRARIAEGLIAGFHKMAEKKLKNNKYFFVNMAIDAYLKIDLSTALRSVDLFRYWRRAIELILQFNKQDPRLQSIKNLLEREFFDSSAVMSYFHFSIGELLFLTLTTQSEILRLVMELLSKQECVERSPHIEDDNSRLELAVLYLEFALKVLKKFPKERNLQSRCLKALGDRLVQKGDYRCNDSPLVAISFFKKALDVYIQMSKQIRDEWGINEKIDFLRKKIVEMNAMDVLHKREGVSIDVSEAEKQARGYVKGQNDLLSALIRYSTFNFVKYEEYLSEIKELTNETVLSKVCRLCIRDNDGRVIAIRPPLLNATEVDWEKETIHNFSLSVELFVCAFLWPAYQQIKEEHWSKDVDVEKIFLKLCEDSPIVPPNKKNLLAQALHLGFQGQWDICIYLLAPLVEDMVRFFLLQQGVLVTQIKDEIETYFGLSSLLSVEASSSVKSSRELLGNDLWFELQAVFASPFGFNLRNRAAHGLLNDKESQSSSVLYAWWMVLREVVRSIIREFKKTNYPNEHACDS